MAPINPVVKLKTEKYNSCIFLKCILEMKKAGQNNIIDILYSY